MKCYVLIIGGSFQSTPMEFSADLRRQWCHLERFEAQSFYIQRSTSPMALFVHRPTEIMWTIRVLA